MSVGLNEALGTVDLLHRFIDGTAHPTLEAHIIWGGRLRLDLFDAEDDDVWIAENEDVAQLLAGCPALRARVAPKRKEGLAADVVNERLGWCRNSGHQGGERKRTMKHSWGPTERCPGPYSRGRGSRYRHRLNSPCRCSTSRTPCARAPPHKINTLRSESKKKKTCVPNPRASAHGLLVPNPLRFRLTGVKSTRRSQSR